MGEQRLRRNAGKPNGLPLLFDNITYINPESNTPEEWAIYDKGDSDNVIKDGLVSHIWKLCAKEIVYGTANYQITISGDEISSYLDQVKLKAERPELYNIVNKIAKEHFVPMEATANVGDQDINDKYGQLAIIKPPYRLTPLQTFWRGVIEMRRRQIEWWLPDIREAHERMMKEWAERGKPRDDSWHESIVQKWYGAWINVDPDKARAIPPEILAEAKAFINRGDVKKIGRAHV